MNPLLVYRHRLTEYKEIEPVLFPESPDDIHPDQSPNDPKFYDKHGYLQSDISLLFRAVELGDRQLTQSITSRIDGNISDSSYLPDGLTEDQMFAAAGSRYAQTASEVQSLAAWQSSILDVEDSTPSPSSDSSGKIDFSSSDAPSSE